jgi:hypothetical protein
MYSIHTHVHTHTHTQTHTHTRTHKHPHTHTNTHPSTLSHTQTHTYTKQSKLLCGYAESLCIRNVEKRVKVHRGIIAFLPTLRNVNGNEPVTHRTNILISGGVAD